MAAKVRVQPPTLRNKNYLAFAFSGHLSEEEAVTAIGSWRNMVKDSKPGSTVNLIYDCTEMTGFDTQARRKWQDAMAELKSKSGVIWIVSTNVFILTAAKTMGLLTGYNIKAARSLSDIS